MSVEQRIRISCDEFDCTKSISCGIGLTRARTMTSEAGWVNTIHYVGPDRRAVLQDFCPEHREQAFDWRTFNFNESVGTETAPRCLERPVLFIGGDRVRFACAACGFDTTLRLDPTYVHVQAAELKHQQHAARKRSE